jgi:hypothetical protein
MFPVLPYRALPTPTTLDGALAEIARLRPVYEAARVLAADTEHVATHYRHSVIDVVTAVTAAENLISG